MLIHVWSFIKIFIEQMDGIRLFDVLFCICIAVVVALSYAFVSNKRNQPKSIGFILFVFWAALYFEMTALITIIRREPGTDYHSGKIVAYIYIGDLNGDAYSIRQAIYNYLNVALFIPIGFFLKGLRINSKEFKDAIITVFLGFLFSFCIEITQIITKRGNFELNDIVTNTIGAILGVIIFEILRRVSEYEENKQ